MLSTYLEDCFMKDLEVCSCWRRYVTGGQVLGVQSHVLPVCSLCFLLVDQDVSSQLLFQHHSCLLVVILSAMRDMDSNSLEL